MVASQLLEALTLLQSKRKNNTNKHNKQKDKQTNKQTENSIEICFSGPEALPRLSLCLACRRQRRRLVGWVLDVDVDVDVDENICRYYMDWMETKSI